MDMGDYGAERFLVDDCAESARQTIDETMQYPNKLFYDSEGSAKWAIAINQQKADFSRLQGRIRGRIESVKSKYATEESHNTVAP